jgi:hypothetical protein
MCPIILARRRGGALDDTSENTGGGGVQVRRIGWEGDTQQLGVG